MAPHRQSRRGGLQSAGDRHLYGNGWPSRFCIVAAAIAWPWRCRFLARRRGAWSQASLSACKPATAEQPSVTVKLYDGTGRSPAPRPALQRLPAARPTSGAAARRFAAKATTTGANVLRKSRRRRPPASLRTPSAAVQHRAGRPRAPRRMPAGRSRARPARSTGAVAPPRIRRRSLTYRPGSLARRPSREPMRRRAPQPEAHPRPARRPHPRPSSAPPPASQHK